MVVRESWYYRLGHFPSAAAQTKLRGAALARNWWAIALRGVAAILFGGIVLFAPGIALLAFILLFAAYALLDGILAIIAAVRAARGHERWGLLVFAGIADLVAAAIAIALPGLTLLAIMILISAWALVTGGLALAATLQLDLDHGQVWMLVGGVASVVFGVSLLIAPLLGAIVLTWWVGAYAIVSGIASLILAIRLRTRRHGDVDRATPAAPGAAASA